MDNSDYNLDTPQEMLGYAVGYMGMSVRDFLGLADNESYSLTYSEFICIHKWHEKKMNDMHRSHALVCCTLANINRDTKKRKTPYTYEDFMFTVKPKISSKQLLTKFKTLLKVKK